MTASIQVWRSTARLKVTAETEEAYGISIEAAKTGVVEASHSE
jgi:hypothetical protein